ncbi:MAG: ABC transporter permease [Candidatus Bathyarchaeia archaeon]|jgi:ABC-2 type transport system permease protein
MNRFARDTSTVTVKELRQLLRDPLSLALTIMFPILLIQLFVVIVTAFSAPSYNIAVVVSDLDGSSTSKSLVDKLTSSRLIKVTQFFQTEEQALNAVESGTATGAVIIPKGFGDALLGGRQAFVILQTDNSKITSSELVQSAVSSSTQSLLEAASARLGAAPVEVILRPISGRPPTGDTFLPGMLGMITILGAFDDIVNAITRERERGTFPRLVLTPTSILSIYSGKISATIVLNAARTTLMLVIFTLTGLVVRGNVLLVYLTTTLIAVFTMSLGLLLSTKIHSSSTLTILEIAITFPLFQLAGAVQAPELLASGGRAIAAILPWTYGNDALRRVIYLGVGFDAIALDIMVLLLSSLVLLPIATLLSKRTM